MDRDAFLEFERLATASLSGTNTAATAEAQRRLAVVGESLEYVDQLQFVLDNTENPYAVVVAVTSLRKLVTEHWTSFEVKERLQIRNYMLGYLASRGPKLDRYAARCVIALLVRVTKLAWFDAGDEIRHIVDEASKLLAMTVHHCVLGLKVLEELVLEMNTRLSDRTITEHRKVASSFRDLALLHAVEIGLTVLYHLATNRIPLDDLDEREAASVQEGIVQNALSLLINAFNFDFIGTNSDESTGDVGTLQIPSSWRECIQNPATMRLLFALYRGLVTGEIPAGQLSSPAARSSTSSSSSASTSSSALTASSSSSSSSSSRHDSVGAASSSLTSLALGAPLGARSRLASVGGPLLSSLGGGAGPDRGGGRVEDYRIGEVLDPHATRTGPVTRLQPSEEHAKLALEVITQLASVRRSLFNRDDDRRAFLVGIMSGVVELLRHRLGLDSEECYHRFCRLLGRLKANYQLTELLRTDLYREWIELVANFSAASFDNLAWAQNSLHFILGLWSKLVAAVPYVKYEVSRTSGSGGSGGGGGGGDGGGDGSDPRLDRFAPQVLEAYVRARLRSVERVLRDEEDDVFTNPDAVEAEIDSITGLCRYQYRQVCDIVLGLLDEHIDRFNVLDARRASGSPEGVEVEVRLAWLVYLVAGMIAGETFGAAASGGIASPENIDCDANLLRRVLHIMGTVEARMQASDGASRSDPRLALALLYFTQCFRRAFIGEQFGMPPPALAAAIALAGSASGGPGGGPGGSSSLISQPVFGKDSGGSGGAAGGGGGSGGSGASGAAGGRPGRPRSAVARPKVGIGGDDDDDRFGSADDDDDDDGDGTTGVLVSLREVATYVNGGGGGSGGAGEEGGRAGSGLTTKQRQYVDFFVKVGSGDHTSVMSSMINYLCSSLRFWGDEVLVLQKTLDTLDDLVSIHSSVRLLNTLDAVGFVLTNHGPSNFPFLTFPGNERARTSFYASLSRILFMQEDPELRFEAFFAPFLAQLDELRPVVGRKNEDVMRGIVGLCRDLRGVLEATHNRRTFGLVFDALFPERVSVLADVLEHWSDTPPVTISLLKCFMELVFNRSSRVNFGSSSPNGVILFKETSRVVTTFTARILALPLPDVPGDLYPRRLKSVMVALTILARALDGGYCPFGVFELYDDRALDDALEAGIELLRSVEPAHLTGYPKLARAFFSLLHILFRSHLPRMVNLPPETFLRFMLALRDGLESGDTMQSTDAAAAIDFLATAFVRGLRKERVETGALQAQLELAPALFETLMQRLFEAIVFADLPNQWSLTRPLLSLMVASVVIRPAAFDEYRVSLATTQPPELQDRLQREFDRLMDGITQSLDLPNRERFAQRMTVFRLAVREFVKL